MAQKIGHKHYDVAVIGGGSAGVAASIAAAKSGAKTVLVDAGPMIGGELLSGLPINSMISARGEWVVRGVAEELLDECKRLGGYVGDFFDWRSLWLVCFDPEIMKIAVVNTIQKYGVSLLLYTLAEDVIVEDGFLKGIVVLNKSSRTVITADAYIDCSGDGDIAMMAGAPFELGGENKAFQPVSMLFRMTNVDTEPFLRFVRDHPENVALGELPLIEKSKRECAEELYRQGFPKAFFDGNGPLLQKAFAAGELYQTPLVAVVPVSNARREVSINTTRVNLDATQTATLSGALPKLLEQVWMCLEFLKKRVPGFKNSAFSGVAPRIGIRETRRIMGDCVLTAEDVLEAHKSDGGVGKGAHELDVHGAGNEHKRIMLKDGGSYDIPYGCLVPRNVKNLLVAGRCLSATREAHGSARVMGSCMATGHGAGVAAALAADRGIETRAVPVADVRELLREQGAVLDGTY